MLKNLKKKKKNWFEVQSINENVFHTYFWCPIRITDSKIKIDDVKNKLKKKNIEIRSRYKFPLYKQKVIQHLKVRSSQNYKRIYLKNSEKISGKILGLPNHYKLKKKHLDYIIENFSKLYD